MTCKDLKQDLTLAATNCLDSTRLNAVLQHCDTCAGCASRLEQFRLVASAHSRAATELDGLALRYRHSASSDRQRVMNFDLTRLSLIWRWLLPIGAVAAIAVGFLVKEQMTNPILPQMNSRKAAVSPKGSVDQAPTLAAYRKAVEKEASFDALLARDADRLLRGVPRQNLRSLLDEPF